MPAVTAIICAAAGWQPFLGRLVLFAVPAVMLLIWEGIAEALRRIPPRHRQRAGLVLIPVVVYLLLPGFKEFSRAKRTGTANRTAVESLARHYQRGDQIMINRFAAFPFWYYSSRTGLAGAMPRQAFRRADGRWLKGSPVLRLNEDLTSRPDAPEGRAAEYLTVFYATDGQGLMSSGFLVPVISRPQRLHPGRPPLPGPNGRIWVFLSQPRAGLREHIITSLENSARHVRPFPGRGATVDLFVFHAPEPEAGP